MQHEITLRLIDEIARAGSIRGAAEKMALTPSALNRRLLAVEEELDVPLFERLASGVRLNAAGELFIAHVRRQLADTRRLRSQIEDLKGVRRGHIHVAFDDSLEQTAAFARAMADYQSAHPGVTFGVDVVPPERLAADLNSYRADLGYALRGPVDTTIVSVASAPARVVAVMAPDHPIGAAGIVRLESLVGQPIVLPPQGSLRTLLDIAMHIRKIPLNAVTEARSDFVHARIRHGDVIGFEAEIEGARRPRDDGLLRLPLSEKDMPATSVHLLQLRGRSVPVAAGQFAETIKIDLAAAVDAARASSDAET
ncbi:MAG: LysR family transcriptional regulator [Pseudomonadota bacterium]